MSGRISVTLASILLAACDAASRDEVAWANAPDGRTHAILSETNGGATTSFGYVIELHPFPHRGERPVAAGKIYGAVRNGCAYGVDLRWLDQSTLALRFESAKSVDVPASVVVGGRSIRVVTEIGVTNPSAPCGGMAYNRSS